MVLGSRHRATRVSISLPKLVAMAITLSVFILLEPTHGQPNYYFKASAPAVKSLPRIGRRSDDGEGSGPFTYPRSMDVPGGILMWQGGDGNGAGSQLDTFSSSGSRPVPSPSTPNSPSLSQNNNQMSKALLWRKLFGDVGGNSYDDILLDSLFASKS